MTRTAIRGAGSHGRLRRLAATLVGVALVGGVLSLPLATPAGAATPGGSVLAWGYNHQGQLGNGTTAGSTTPVAASLNGTTITAVSAGGLHSLALTSTGSALAWGYNSNGQLGDGTNTGSTTPVAVSLNGTTVTAVSAGRVHSLALTSAKSVLAWGYNGYGQLGDGTNNDSTTPVAVSLNGTTVTAVSAGNDFSLALTSTGSVLAWGKNQNGELGDGTNNDSTTPVAVHLPADTTVTAVDAGNDFSLALTSTGSVLAWGYNGSGQLGNATNTDSSTPVAVHLPADTTVTAISGGAAHSLALTSTGSALAWGRNQNGELGSATTGQFGSSTPVAVSLPADTTVTAISGGGFFSLALTSTGSVLAWGWNADGELGNNSTTGSTTPVAVSLPADTTVTAVSAGTDHSLALTPKRPTTTTATATPAASTSGDTVTYGATVAPVTGTGTPTGTVTFTVGAVTLCTTPALDGAGSGSCTATNAPVGTDTVVATYSGDATFATSTGNTTETVTAGPATQIVLSGATGNLASGATRTLTATIEDAAGNTVTSGADSADALTFSQTAGTGSVTFATPSLTSGGVATDVVTGNVAGPVTITAAGTVNSVPTNSNPLAFTVTFGTATQIVLSGATTDLASGATRTLTATIEDAAGNTVTSGADSADALTFSQTAGTGSVTFATPSSTSGGVATDVVTGNVAGPVTITAAGTVNSVPTNSNTLTFNVTAGAATQIVLSGATTDLASATTRTFTATIEDAAGNTVTSGADSTDALTFSQTAGTGSVTFATPSSTSGGVATDVVTGNVAGPVTITAAGTVNSVPTNSNTLTFTVTFGTATHIVLSGATTSLASGATRTLTATIEDAAGNTVTSGADSADALTFSQTAGTGSVTFATPSLTSGGVATDVVTGNVAGPVTITAAGTVNSVPTNSNPLAFTVTAAGGGGGGGGPPPPPAPPSGATSSQSCSSSSSSGTATCTNDGTTVSANGEGSLTVSQYGSDPVGSPTFSASGVYLDVEVASGSSFSSLTITDCNLNGATSLEWWNGSAWLAVSPESYSAGPPKCVTATLDSTSSPTIADLTGTVFAGALPAATAPGAPTGLGATPGNTTAILSWTAPSSNGGSTILGYDVYEGTTPGGESTTPVNGTTLIGATSYTVGGLTNGTTYYFDVQAVNSVGSSVASNEASATPTSTPTPTPTPTTGYWEVASDGGIFSFGNATFYGSMGGTHLNKPIVGMGSAPAGKGYWLVASDGGVFNFGDAGYYGSMGGKHLNSPVVGMAPTPDGKGYWLVASDGGIFTFGDAGYYGSMGGQHLNSPVVGMAPTPDGKGYWLVASDGGVFNFGDAGLFGSMGGHHLNSPVVGMAPTPDGKGYWLVASDGGIFSFNAPFFGSMGRTPFNKPMVAMAEDPYVGTGYWTVASDGGVFSFLSPFFGSMGGHTLNMPIVGMAASL
jgi:alpha-tubulin suppressor-like RCC1 family protein